MQISELTAMIMLAVAIIGMIGFAAQAVGKWFELQTARINKELAKSKNEETVKLIDSQNQSRRGSSTGIGRWFLGYLWKNQKVSIAICFGLFSGPMIWGTLKFGDNPPNALFIWTVVHLSFFCYLIAYFVLNETGEAYLAHRMAERERERAAILEAG